MRKIIFGLINLSLFSVPAFSVIACTPKTYKSVILEFPTDNQGSSIAQAYRNVVNRFNEEHPNSPYKVKLLVTPLNSVKDKIATGYPLPNLYISYADPISTYDVLLQLRDSKRSVVNMAEVIDWNTQGVPWWDTVDDWWLKDYLDNGERENQELFGDKTLNQIINEMLIDHQAYRPFINSFLRESLIPNETMDGALMYSAPGVKSNYIGAVNLRLLNELVVKVLGEEAKIQLNDGRQIRDPFFIKEAKIELKNVKINSNQNRYPLSSRNHYLSQDLTFGQFFEQFSGQQTTNHLQRLLGDLSIVEVLLSTYWNLVGADNDNTADNWVKTLAYATDDVYATTGLMQGQLTGDFKQFISWDAENPFALSIDTKTDKLHQGLNDFLNFIQWGNTHKKLLQDGANTSDHGNGGIGIKANSVSKDYYSNQWIKQGMLLYYGSSAGVKYMSSTKENQVQNDDILLAPIPVYEDTANKENWSMLYRQQAPGMGMFKDKNIVKNQVAAAFLNYFLSPKINAEFAIQSGYLPTNYYTYFTEDRPNKALPDLDSIYYQELLSAESRIKGPTLIKNLIDQLATEQIKLWISEPSPFSEMLNFQVIQPWFQKYYKTFFANGPNSEMLTWTQFEKNFHQEAKRVIKSMLPGITYIMWNGVKE